MSNYEMGGSFQKAITMLTKGSVQYLRQEFNAIQNLRYGKGSKTQNIKNFAIAHFLLPMTWQFFADGFEWESDEQLRAAIFGNFNSLFLIGGVAETIYDKAILKKRVGDVMQVSPIMSIQKDSEVLAEQAIKMLGDKKITDKDIERTISNMARVAGKTTGLPIDQAIKAVKLVKDLANNDTGDDFDTARRIMGFSKYVIDKNKPKKKKVKPIL
jgi:hypothetical protein